MARELEKGQYKEPGILRKFAKTFLNIGVTAGAGAAVGAIGNIGAGYIQGEPAPAVTTPTGDAIASASATVGETAIASALQEAAAAQAAAEAEALAAASGDPAALLPAPPLVMAMPAPIPAEFRIMPAPVDPSAPPAEALPEGTKYVAGALMPEPKAPAGYVAVAPAPREVVAGDTPKVDPAPDTKTATDAPAPDKHARFMAQAKEGAQYGAVAGAGLGGLMSIGTWTKREAERRSGRDLDHNLSA